MLIYNSNIFHVNRRYDNKIFWKCMNYRITNCKCRVTTSQNEIRQSSVVHNHLPHTDQIQVKVRSKKYRATSCYRTIYNSRFCPESYKKTLII
ncbi:hypothetical protein MTP99_005085 [Tenebrio molitor]|nr:hypothetical protein MTP99_005085 [Tenebrio molitor]